jgi:hypothetical protein
MLLPAQILGNARYETWQQICLQWLATNEIRPSADFSWDTFLAGELSVHALGKKLSSLLNLLAYERGCRSERITLGSIHNGTPKSTAFLRIT